MTNASFLLPTNLATWYYQFAHLNSTYLKCLPDMTSEMKIFAGAKNLFSCIVCIQVKMIKQPHHDPHIFYKIPKFCIYLEFRGNANVYATWKGYWYFALFVNNATCVTWVCFIKKKFKVLSIFKDFIILLERYYIIWVCILYTDFGDFNSNSTTEYFIHISILWEVSVPNAKQ